MITTSCLPLPSTGMKQKCQEPNNTNPKVNGECNFEPNSENNEYRKKFLGVKKRNYKK